MKMPLDDQEKKTFLSGTLRPNTCSRLKNSGFLCCFAIHINVVLEKFAYMK